MYTVLVLSKIEKINATAPQPQRNVLKYLAIFKNIAHSLGVTRRLTRLQAMYNVLKFCKHDQLMSKEQFTGTAMQPQIMSI